MSIFDNIKLKSNGKGGYNYVITQQVSYFSMRYQQFIIAEKGEHFDGATGAMDIDSKAWIIHDVLCRDGCFAGGDVCTNLQASTILSDILKEDGFWFRARSWFTATWLFGGGKARDNGLW